MANAVLSSSHFHVDPAISQYRKFPAKNSASKKPRIQEPEIKRTSKTNFNSMNRRKSRRFDDSVSSIRKLLFCLNSGRLEAALHLFDQMPQPNTFVWNVMIRALVNSGMFEQAIDFYYRMQIEGIKSDHLTYPFVIKACIFNLEKLQKVHSYIIKLGFDSDIYVCNALVSTYAKVGSIENSEKIFDHMPVKDRVSWNSMIGGYAFIKDGWSSLMCFREMQESGIEPDRFSYISALTSCSMEHHLLGGKEILCRILRKNFELNLMIRSSLIDTLGKCGGLDLAEKLFCRISERNVVVWNAMIGAYVFNDRCFESFSCLKRMQCLDDVAPDVVTLINLLPACSKTKALLHGKAVHGHAIRKGYLQHLVLTTALIDMYGKCGNVELAKRVFCKIEERNLVSWNTMIATYVMNSKNREAVETFRILLNESLRLDFYTFGSIVSAYAEIALPKEGKLVHGCTIKLGISSGQLISNALIHMYARCGDLESARKVFDGILFKDVVSWNTMIMAYGIHGFGERCFMLFDDMLNNGNEPNGSTFVSLLTGCSVGGFINEGWKYFDLMKQTYGIDPGIEHYGCMIDLLGRSGELDHAKKLIEAMPLAPTRRIWGALLVASRHHKNIEMAEMAADRIFSLHDDKDNTGLYILLSNMYAEVGKWEDVDRIKLLMKDRGLESTIACSIVESNGRTSKFTNHDRLKIEKELIYGVLDILSRGSGGEGVYGCSASKFKVSDVMKRRETSPTCHSVRLAICCGLIGTRVGDPVIVRKNVRICENCHRVGKKFTMVSNREIIVGDSKIFHRFKDGQCSCNDYW